MPTSRTVLVVGSGLTGSTVAHALARADVNDYRHRVDIIADGLVLNWPLLVSEIDRHSGSEAIRRELAEREAVDAEHRAQATNSEEWRLELIGPTLYGRFVRPYTEKQWGRPARELRATWGPRRVGIRWDEDLDLAQGAMVVNHPGREFPFIRIHETKHASRQQVDGTVLGFEFTNAPDCMCEALDVSDEVLAALRVTA